jgi:four helix bundle protein
MNSAEEFDANAWMVSFWEEGVGDVQPRYGEGGRRRNPLVEEAFEMASRVMDYSERLVRVNHVFASQILRSGTAVGSHTREAQGADSLADFVHKIKIGFKELEETDYRMELCHVKGHYPHDPELMRRIKALFPLFNSILRTSKERLASERRSKKG